MKLTLLLLFNFAFVSHASYMVRSPSSAEFESNFMSAPGQFPSLHASTMTEIPSQKMILGCWYAGSREMGTDVQIYCSRAEQQKMQWSTATVVVKAQDTHTGDFLASKSIGNPVLYHDPDSEVTYLFFGTVTLGGWRGVRPFYRTSVDFGKTWSKSIPIDGEFDGQPAGLGRIGKFVRIKPLRISKSELMVPMYSEWDDKRSFTCMFKKTGQVFKEEKCQDIPGHQSLQPSLVYLNDKLRAFTRSKVGFILTSEYDFKNNRWAPLVMLDVPNPDSSVESISTGDRKTVLLIGNARPQGRNSLDLLASTDGLTFKKVHTFEESADDKAEYSYPAVIRTDDGVYHLSYTYLRKGIKHIQFSETWLQDILSKSK